MAGGPSVGSGAAGVVALSGKTPSWALAATAGRAGAAPPKGPTLHATTIMPTAPTAKQTAPTSAPRQSHWRDGFAGGGAGANPSSPASVASTPDAERLTGVGVCDERVEPGELPERGGSGKRACGGAVSASRAETGAGEGRVGVDCGGCSDWGECASGIVFDRGGGV